MQPYIFPYIGYYQLMYDLEVFVSLDDVNFVNKGWINRNRILVNGAPQFFTIPVVKSSQNKKINELLRDWACKLPFNRESGQFQVTGAATMELIFQFLKAKKRCKRWYSFVNVP